MVSCPTRTKNLECYLMFLSIIIKVFTSCSVSVQFQTLEMGVLKVLQEFAGGTSIHGFTFLVSPKTSARSKIIWAISLVVAMMYASAEMRNSAISKYH